MLTAVLQKLVDFFLLSDEAPADCGALSMRKLGIHFLEGARNEFLLPYKCSDSFNPSSQDEGHLWNHHFSSKDQVEVAEKRRLP
jgi:hypothetical protein